MRTSATPAGASRAAGTTTSVRALPHFACSSRSVEEDKALRFFALFSLALGPDRGSTTAEEARRNSLLSQGDHSSPAALPARKVRESHSPGGSPLAVAREVLSSPAAEGPLWTLTRLAREIEVRSGETISPGHLSVVLRKGAIAGAGRAIAAKAGRTPARSTVPACGSGS
jgi:hypothetical protein